MSKRFPYRRTFILGFGFLGISVIWPIFNNYVPIFLKENFGLSAAMIGFVMTWDNYLNMFVQPLVGDRSDRTRTRIGRRKPFMLIGAPLAALFFITIPLVNTVPAIMLVLLFTNLSMALFRAPTVALLGDLFPSEQRSTANGIINLMGGIGAILALLVGGILYSQSQIAPFVFGSIILLVAISVVLIFIKEPKIEPENEISETKTSFLENVREVLKSADRSGLYVLLAILCWFMGWNALETWISSFGKFSLGIDEGFMAILTSGLALMFVLSALPSGLLATRFGRKRVIMIGIVGLVLLFLYGLLISNMVMLIVMLVPAGFFWALINVNSLPMVYDVGGNVRIGAFTGMYYFSANLAAVAGPQTVGFLIDWTNENYKVMFVFAAIFMALAGLFMSRVREKKSNGIPQVEGA